MPESFKKMREKFASKKIVPCQLSSWGGLAWPSELLLFLILIAFSTNYYSNVIISSVLTFFVFLSLFATSQEMDQLRIEKIVFPQMYSNTPFEVSVSLKNPTNSDKNAIELDVFSNKRISLKRKNISSKTIISDIGSQSNLELFLPATCLYKRGKHEEILGVNISTRWPFGLFRYFYSAYNPAQPFWVYPELEADLHPYPASSHLNSDTEEAVKFLPSSQAQPFVAGFREYRHGDNVKDIAWKKSTHSDNFVSKIYEYPADSCLVFSWEHVASMEKEAAIQRLATWVHSAFMENLEFQLILPHHHSNKNSGYSHYHNCMQQLAEM